MPPSSASCGVGFVCQVSGAPSRQIVSMGLEAVKNLTHRGAMGSDGKSGDGAGILIQIPRAFFSRELQRLGISHPGRGTLALGVFFLSAPAEPRIEQEARAFGMKVLAWRTVPIDEQALGQAALHSLPEIRHLFLDAGAVPEEERERQLYLLRRSLERNLAGAVIVCSLSCRTMVYKGMLVANHLDEFYPDLRDDLIQSAFSVFHQRFSTNTSPEWGLAQPFRVLAHNGEINTLQGNRHALAALSGEVKHDLFGERNDLLAPLTDRDESDSASLDRIVELLVHAGWPPEHAVLTCIPPAWEHADLESSERAFFEYHSLLMRPWDGPAAVVFTDGRSVGAHLDRNGLRPLRYTLTGDGLLVLGSETGMIDLGERSIAEKGRLGPGEILSVDLNQGRLRQTREIVRELARARPYGTWLDRNLARLIPAPRAADEAGDLHRLLVAFGYSREELDMQLTEMAGSGREMVFSMGDDTPLPPLSNKPHLLFRYFKQRFSQVTNPPIDPIRERLVMSLTMKLGYKRNFLEPVPESARRLALESPILQGGDLDTIRSLRQFKPVTIDICYDRNASLSSGVRSLQDRVTASVAGGSEIVILTDRGVSKDRAAIPSLLAAASSLRTLQQQKTANRASVVMDTGEARDVHHLACLIGFGISAVYPWLAYSLIEDLCLNGSVPLTFQQACSNYIRALEDGLLKVIARLGISTLGSYHGARLFDAICLKQEFLTEYFGEITGEMEAEGLQEIEASQHQRHNAAFGVNEPELGFGGALKYRPHGEYHGWSPPVVQALNRFIKSRDYADYQAFSRKAEEVPTAPRHLVTFRPGKAVSIDEVEPEEMILKRFFSGAMSVGALSPEAHETIAEACNRLGIRSNSGEGGEDPDRYFSARGSAIKQIASGRFGVTPTYLASAKELEIKIAQGAKPGEGGHLPGSKVTGYIAMLRHCKPGIMLISPPPHHDIYSIEDLAQLVYDLKQANSKALVCVKLVAEAGVGTVAAGVAKCYADIVQISGCEGGTGAAAITSIKNAGNVWETGLAETVRILAESGLRSRVRVRVDGGLRTGRDVVVAALLGAEEFGFGTATMIAAGCVMARQCHSNTCPTGVATQDEKLRKRFRGTTDGVVAYFQALAREVREIMAAMGAPGMAAIIGRSDLLMPVYGREHPAGKIDCSPLLAPPPPEPRFCTLARNDNPAPSMNKLLAAELGPAIEAGQPIAAHYEIRNIHRSIPVALNELIARKHGQEGLPDDTICITFTGTAGQSFGAFNHRGMSLTLVGDANDYAGKGMYGGRIAIIPSDLQDEPHHHVIVGNAVLYGAVGGEFFCAGTAGERFAVRNSGARAVVEGAGLHMCEYMTAGTVVVIGEVGMNVGAGMTGGSIYILDEAKTLVGLINAGSVRAVPIEEEDDINQLRDLIISHFRHTGSQRADEILTAFNDFLPLFVKVIPR